MSFSPAGGADSAPLNSFAGFNGKLWGEDRRGKGKERRGKGKGGNGLGKHHRHLFPVSGLWPATDATVTAADADAGSPCCCNSCSVSSRR